MSRRILCFGDSNTWGYNGADGSRFDENTRWTAVLQKSLGLQYTIIEEGLNGRTVCIDDSFEDGKNGLRYLLPCMESHMPFELLIVMLGTNDMKSYFDITASDIADGMERLIRTALKFFQNKQHLAETKIMILSPVCIGKKITGSSMSDIFDQTAAAKSEQLSELYRTLAHRYDCHFLDAAQYAQAGLADSVHIDADGHASLAIALKNYITQNDINLL